MERWQLVVLSAFLVACQAGAVNGTPCARDADCASGVCRFGVCRTGCVENRDCPVGASCLRDPSGASACGLDIDLGCETGVGRMCASGLVCVADRCVQPCTTASQCPADGECRMISTGGPSFCFDARLPDAGVPLDGAPGDGGSGDAGVDAAPSDAAQDDASTDAATDAGAACAVRQMCFERDVAGCAIDCHGRVWCWGNAHNGALGDGMSRDAIVTTPVGVVDETGSPLVDVGSLACGDGFACAWVDGASTGPHAGHVMCWGYDQGSGAFAQSDFARDLATPFVLAHATLAGNYHHTCAIDEDAHTLRCFGIDDGVIDPAMDDATTFPDATLVAVSDVRAVALAAGGACAIDVSGVVRCWGDDHGGEAGVAPIDVTVGVQEGNVVAPHVVSGSGGPVSGVTQLARGYQVAVALVGTSLLTWGSNEFYALGESSSFVGERCDEPIGLTVCRSSARSISTSPLAFVASAGDGHTVCAITAETPSHVHCWGYADDGRVGILPGAFNRVTEGSHTQVLTSSATSPALEGIAAGQLYLGTANGCAVLEADGSLWCWGANLDGQLAMPADMPIQPHLATRIVIPSP